MGGRKLRAFSAVDRRAPLFECRCDRDRGHARRPRCDEECTVNPSGDGSGRRPGGYSTGLTSLAPELEGKRLELLREVVPKLSFVAVLWNPGNAYMIGTEKEVQAAAQVLSIKVLSFGV